MASELEFDLWDTVDWGKKWLVDFSTRKTQLVLFDQSITMVLLVLSRKNHLLRCWAWPEVALYLYKCTICPCMGYCCPVWAGAPSSYLELLDKLLKRICRTVGPSLAVSLEALAHCQNVASLSLFYRYHFGRSSSTDWLNWFYFLFLKGGLLVILTDCMIFLFSLAWSESQSKKPF